MTQGASDVGLAAAVQSLFFRQMVAHERERLLKGGEQTLGRTRIVAVALEFQYALALLGNALLSLPHMPVRQFQWRFVNAHGLSTVCIRAKPNVSHTNAHVATP